MYKTLNCPICFSNDIHFYINKNGYDIYKCKFCYAGFVNLDQIDKIDPKIIYDDEYYKSSNCKGYFDYFAEDRNLSLLYKKILQWIEKEQKKGKIIEVGCAMGFFLKEAELNGWEAEGYDVSEYSVNYAKRLGLKAICIDFLSQELNFKNSSYDVAVAFDVIEHLKNPHLFLIKLNSLLKKDGTLILSTGNILSISSKLLGVKWRIIAPPMHLYYFSKKSLRILLEQNKFSIIEFKYFTKFYSLSSILAFLGFKNSFIFKRISIPLNLYDIVYVKAKKI